MILALSRNRLLRLFSGTVVDQAMLSAVNFIVGLLLIRHTTDLDYGSYVLVQTGVALLVSLQGAWLGGPVSVLAPKKDAATRRAMVGVAYFHQRRLGLQLLALCAVLTVVLAALGGAGGVGPAIFAAGALASWAAIERDYLRSVLLIYQRPQVMLLVDVAYVAVLVGGVALALIAPVEVATFAVLANAAAAALASFLMRRSVARDPGWNLHHDAGLWREMRPLSTWAVVGVVVYWSFSQGYNYLLAAMLDVQAVAAVAATRLLLMPVNLLTTGVKGLLIPTVAGWLRESGLHVVMRRLYLFGFGLFVLAGIYCLVLWLLRDWVTGTLLHKDIPQRDALMLLWTGIYLMSLVRDVWQTALMVLERFRLLAQFVALNAVVSLVLIVVCTHYYAAPGALVGLAVGEGIYTVIVLVMLRIEQKNAK
jgi:O-antigen/teichoic acid export membrane protein